jgi:hypothetical protein
MNTLRSFEAPWGAPLKVATILACALLLGQCLAGLLLSKMPLLARVALVVLPPVGIGVAALFTIRGYDLTRDSILVVRLFWRTRIPLAGLRDVKENPEAVKRSIRTCGNGGFFSFTGWYYNKQLGKYRMFATDPKRAVVLHFEDRRVVMTPDDPQAFVRSVREKAGLR